MAGYINKKSAKKLLAVFLLFTLVAFLVEPPFHRILTVFPDLLLFYVFLYGLLIAPLVFLYLRVSVFTWFYFLLFLFFKGFEFVLIGALSLGVFLFRPDFLNLISSYIFGLPLLKILKRFKKIPRISKTEREALEAGKAGLEREFFSGRPDFKKILKSPVPSLSEEEKLFLHQQTEELCSISCEWDTIQYKKIDEKALEKIKKEKFLGMILPKSYGGLEFSHKAHALIVQKIASSDMPLATFIAVPNSLGPTSLLLRYGTSKQKKKYLSRLSAGEEIPCFALTEPEAGSDASSISSSGILFKGEFGHLKIKLNWNKRWTTLSVIATLSAVAFRLKDPEQLLGGEKDLGISLILVPTDTPNVKKGFYHNTLETPFYNGPFAGENVILDAKESLIGGLKGAGKGWKMIMETLSFGRGISIPSLALGGILRAVKISALYAGVRKQFGRPIGDFEGIKEPLARITGLGFLSQSLRDFLVSDLSAGSASPTAAAIAKYSLTEFHQKILKDSMDILSGAGISLGPKNKLALLHIASPIFITVEGTNILTRSFILFGQGLLKSHPFLNTELKAIEKGDFKSLNAALFKHIYCFVSNLWRAVCLSFTRGLITGYSLSFKKGRRFIQKLSWSAVLFSVFVEVFLLRFGSRFRFKEALSGRFSDILSYQYMASALLWKWNARFQSASETYAIKWGLYYCMNQIQKSFEELILNMNIPWLLKKPLYFLTRFNSFGPPPSDKLSNELADALLSDSALFKNLTEYVYVSKDPEDSLNKLQKALKLSKEAQPLFQKMKKALKQKKLSTKPFDELIISAKEKGILSEEEEKLIRDAKKARIEAIQVDSFTKEQYFSTHL